MPKLPLSLLLLALVSTSCSLAGDSPWNGFHANGFVGLDSVGLDGSARNVSVSGGALAGNVDIRSKSDSSTYYGARAGLAPFELVFSDLSLNTRNPSSLAAGGTFLGNTVTTDLASTTVVDMEIRKLLLGIDLINADTFRIGFLIGVDEVDFNDILVISDQAFGGVINPGDSASVVHGETAWVPLLGVRGDVDLPFDLRLGAELSGMSINTNGVQADYWDFDGSVNYEFTPHIEGLIGYRYVDMGFQGTLGGTSLDSSFTLDGPYVAVGVSF